MKGINEQCTETGSSTEFYYYLDILKVLKEYVLGMVNALLFNKCSLH